MSTIKVKDENGIFQEIPVIQGTNGVGVPNAGTAGQVLVKASDTDYDTVWSDYNPGTQITVDSALSSTSTNPVQNKVINSALAGKLSTSGNAASATKATNDSANQQINTTYIKGLSASGKTITYTKGDNSTGTITTQDTTYSAATTSAAGLMSATDKKNVLYFVEGTQTAATGSWTGSLPGVELYDGLTIRYYLPYAGSGNASLSLNGGTAYPIYRFGVSQRVTTHFSAGSIITMTFRTSYNVSGSTKTNAWIVDAYYDANSTYSNASLGQGLGTCTTAAATAAKTATLSSYAATTGGRVSIKFSETVYAGATLNINNKGAKPIFYKGAAITDMVILAGDTATFIYDGTNYVLQSVDRDIDLSPLGLGTTSLVGYVNDLNSQLSGLNADIMSVSNAAGRAEMAVDQVINNYLPLAGGTMTGAVSFNSSAFQGTDTALVSFGDAGGIGASTSADSIGIYGKTNLYAGIDGTHRIKISSSDVSPQAGTYTLGTSSNKWNAVYANNFYGNATNVTGTVAVANGGTGSTTASGARSNLGAITAFVQSAQPTATRTGDIWFKV